jgi:putative membrane protein
MDGMALVSSLGFLAEALALLFIAKVARDVLLLRRGIHGDQQITEHDNLAAAIPLAAFLLATVIALIDSLVVEGELWLTQATSIAYTGLTVICLLLINGWLTDVIIFNKIDDDQELYTQRNLSLAFCHAGSFLATGFIIKSAFAHPNPWWICVTWSLIGQVILVVMFQIYQWISPYDDLEEIKKGNQAAGLPLAGVLIASGITIESAIYGESISWTDELIAVGLYVIVGSILLYAVRSIFNVLFLPKSDLNHEIVTDQNSGVGLLEGTMYIACAEVITFFLS